MKKINEEIAKGYIRMRKHPSDPELCILNYTAKAQYARRWNDTTMNCRGCIIYENEIISNSFSKFFNFGETKETTLKNLPDELPQITEKLDGSLGILYHHQGKPAIATRGSFDSDMAIWATKKIQNMCSSSDFIPGYTYLFEIIYPENRIVVDYKGRSDLVLLAIRNIKTGIENIDIKKEAAYLGLSHVKYFSGTIQEILERAKQIDGTVQEGFVARYSNGLRIKIKAADYIRLHKIMTECSNKRILDAVKNDTIEDMLTKIPDELYSKIKSAIKSIEDERDEIIRSALIIYDQVKNLTNRKNQAEIIKSSGAHQGIVFALIDGASIDRITQMAYSKITRTHEVWK